MIYLLDNSMNAVTSSQTQLDFFRVINAFERIISNIKTDITDQSEEQKRNF